MNMLLYYWNSMTECDYTFAFFSGMLLTHLHAQLLM
jgi:hypothetical protein